MERERRSWFPKIERERDPFDSTRPATLTRLQPPIPATTPADTATIRSLRDEQPIPVVLVVGKRPERRRFSLKEPRLHPFSSLPIPPALGRTTTWMLILSSPSSFSDQPRHLKPPFWPWTTVGKPRALGAQSAAIATRGRSPPAPLDSPRSELADLSFPSPLTEVRSPLTGRGNSVIL